MKIDNLIQRIDAGASEEIAARSILLRAERLRDRVALAGEYSGKDHQEFLDIVSGSGNALKSSNVTLGERAGLSPDFFSRIARDKRKPKLSNFLKALNGTILVAHERLADVDVGKAAAPAWLLNPLNDNRKMCEAIRTDLLSLVQQLKGSNSLSEVPEVDRHLRLALIQLLETSIEVLKAPLVEPGLLKTTNAKLRKFAERTGNEGASGLVRNLASKVADQIAEVLQSIL